MFVGCSRRFDLGRVMTDDELLDAYLRQTDELRDRRLLRDGQLSDAFHLGTSDNDYLSFTLPDMDEEDLRSFLLDLRKLTSNDEPLFVNKIHNILWRSVEADFVREQLAIRNKAWNKAGKQGKVKLVVDGVDVRPADVFDWWLNGTYFHNDDRKRRRLEALGIADHIGRHLFNEYIVAATNYALFLASAIRFVRSEGLIHP
jgi:hypothetical protein